MKTGIKSYKEEYPKTIMELEQVCKKNDGFDSEKDFSKYLEINLGRLLSDRGEKGLVRYDKEVYLQRFKPFGGNKPRIDYVVETEDKKIGVEVKHPTNCKVEMANAVSQVLYYIEVNEIGIDEFWLVSTYIDPIMISIIGRYKLPIRVFVVNKRFNCEVKPWQGQRKH